MFGEGCHAEDSTPVDMFPNSGDIEVAGSFVWNRYGRFRRKLWHPV